MINIFPNLKYLSNFVQSILGAPASTTAIVTFFTIFLCFSIFDNFHLGANSPLLSVLQGAPGKENIAKNV